MYNELGLKEIIRRAYAKHNIFYVGVIPSNNAVLLSKFAVNKVADLKGKKLRATGLYAEIMNQAGAVATYFPWGEIYGSLEKGVIDGVIAGPLSSDWSLFDAVQRLPFAPIEAQFDLLEHMTVLKPAQILRYRKDLAVQLAGGPKLACFTRHGYATVPQEYWLDEQHRLVLVVAYNMAYLLNQDAPALYERARAERRSKR